MNLQSLLKKFWFLMPVLASILFITFLLLLFDADLGEAFGALWMGAFGTQDKLLSVLSFWVPLLLAATGLLVTFSAGLWNIGVEGQIIMGAVAASGVALHLQAPAWVMVTVELLAAFAAGALWGAITGVLKTKGKVNEIFGGLALTNLAIILTNYLISGPWQPEEGGTFRGTAPFPDEALLPSYQGSVFSPLSLVIAIVALLLIGYTLNNTYWGLRLKALGKHAHSAFLMGVSSERETVMAMVVGGGLAGLGGSVRVLSWFDSLRQSISGGIGYLALLVVMLALFRVVLVPFISFFFSAILQGSNRLHYETQLHTSLGGIFMGVIVLLMLLFGDYKQLGIFKNKEVDHE